MRQQVSQPGGGADVALATRDVAHLHRIGQSQLDLTLQDVPHRLPVHPGGLHGGVGTTLRKQPIHEPQQLARGGPELLDDVLHPSTDHQPRTSHHRLLVNVQPCAAIQQNLHGSAPSEGAPA